MVEEVLVGHGPGVVGGNPGQHRAPAQRGGGGEGLATALARHLARGIDLLQHLLPLGLPVAQAATEQRPGQHDAPVAAFLADADIDELRVEHHLAEAFLDGMHRGAGVARAGQADRLYVDHGVCRAGHGLLQVARTFGRQRQAGVAVERRQLERCSIAAGLGLAAVGIDRIDQLRLFAVGSQARSRNGQA
ncbi:hypothetical protein D3C79_702720 [compost metagenome]